MYSVQIFKFEETKKRITYLCRCYLTFAIQTNSNQISVILLSSSTNSRKGENTNIVKLLEGLFEPFILFIGNKVVIDLQKKNKLSHYNKLSCIQQETRTKLKHKVCKRLIEAITPHIV